MFHRRPLDTIWHRLPIRHVSFKRRDPGKDKSSRAPGCRPSSRLPRRAGRRPRRGAELQPAGQLSPRPLSGRGDPGTLASPPRPSPPFGLPPLLWKCAPNGSLGAGAGGVALAGGLRPAQLPKAGGPAEAADLLQKKSSARLAEQEPQTGRLRPGGGKINPHRGTSCYRKVCQRSKCSGPTHHFCTCM